MAAPMNGINGDIIAAVAIAAICDGFGGNWKTGCCSAAAVGVILLPAIGELKAPSIGLTAVVKNDVNGLDGHIRPAESDAAA